MNELLAELIARDAELARLKNDLTSRDARIDELFELLADSHNNDATRSRRREITAETQPTVVTQQTQQTQQSARSEGEGGKRSGKLPDPPVFQNDEEDRDDFEQWYRDIENKLRTNIDHFHNDQAKQAYIESHLGGKTKRELTPYLRSTHPNPITTSRQLIAHLRE